MLIQTILFTFMKNEGGFLLFYITLFYFLTLIINT